MINFYKVNKAAILISIIAEYYTKKGKHVDYTVDTPAEYLSFKITDDYGNIVTHRINLNTDNIIFAIAANSLSKIDGQFFEFYKDMNIGEEN